MNRFSHHLSLLLSLCRRESCVPLDPSPNLVHHLFSHMTSHVVGGGSGLLPALNGHKEVAETRIHDKLHVTAPTQRILPDLEIFSRDLVIALALQEEHRLFERLRHFLRLIGVQVEPVGSRDAQRQVARGGCRQAPGIFDQLHLFFDDRELLLSHYRIGHTQRKHIGHLIQDNILKWPRRTCQDDQTTNLRVGLANAWSQVATQAMSQHKDLLRVYLWPLAQEGHCFQRIVNDLFLDRECVYLTSHAGGIDFRAFIVAQHSDTLRGQAPGQIAERLVGRDRLVAVLWSRAMHQKHRRKRPAALRNAQYPWQHPFSASYLHLVFVKTLELRVRRRLIDRVRLLFNGSHRRNR